MSFFATPNTALTEYITYPLLPRCFSIVLQSLLLPSSSPANTLEQSFPPRNFIRKVGCCVVVVLERSDNDDDDDINLRLRDLQKGIGMY